MKKYKADDWTSIGVTMKTRKAVNAMRNETTRRTADDVIEQAITVLRLSDVQSLGGE